MHINVESVCVCVFLEHRKWTSFAGNGKKICTELCNKNPYKMQYHAIHFQSLFFVCLFPSLHSTARFSLPTPKTALSLCVCVCFSSHSCESEYIWYYNKTAKRRCFFESVLDQMYMKIINKNKSRLKRKPKTISYNMYYKNQRNQKREKKKMKTAKAESELNI